MATRTRPTRGVSAGAEARERQPVEGVGGWVGGWAGGPREDGRGWDGMGVGWARTAGP